MHLECFFAIAQTISWCQCCTELLLCQTMLCVDAYYMLLTKPVRMDRNCSSYELPKAQNLKPKVQSYRAVKSLNAVHAVVQCSCLPTHSTHTYIPYSSFPSPRHLVTSIHSMAPRRCHRLPFRLAISLQVYTQ